MEDRPRPTVDLARAFPAGARALSALSDTIPASTLDHGLAELVKLRASQINGCAYCIDMHTKDARAAGETEIRLALLSAWRDVEFFTDGERAALGLTEAVTLIADGHVPAEVEDAARAAFDEETYAALVFAIIVINSWNRFAVTGHSVAGHYTSPG